MPTSVRLPANLLQKADKRASALGMSRKKLIVWALQRELEQNSEWSPGFFERLRAIDEETAQEFSEFDAGLKRN